MQIVSADSNKQNLVYLQPTVKQFTAKAFFLQIGQYGYQKMQNFMLIPNLKMKFKKSVPLKSYSKKTVQKAVGLELQHIATVIVHNRYVRRQLLSAAGTSADSNCPQ